MTNQWFVLFETCESTYLTFEMIVIVALYNVFLLSADLLVFPFAGLRSVARVNP